MKFQLIRNATCILTYGGIKILIDPMLADKYTYPAFPGTCNPTVKNPTVDLPIAIEEILDVDLVIITHDHLDHWDEEAKKLISKDQLIFVKDTKDKNTLERDGFNNVYIIEDAFHYKNICITKTLGQHGSDEVMQTSYGDLLGDVCGFIFQHPKEKTVYLAGDTIWNDFVKNSLNQFKPDIAILNAGDAQVEGFGSIIMGKNDVLKVHQELPTASLVAIHMESVNHVTLSRKDLVNFASTQGFDKQLFVPNDGEVLIFNQEQ